MSPEVPRVTVVGTSWNVAVQVSPAPNVSVYVPKPAATPSPLSNSAPFRDHVPFSAFTTVTVWPLMPSVTGTIFGT